MSVFMHLIMNHHTPKNKQFGSSVCKKVSDWLGGVIVYQKDSVIVFIVV